MVSLEEAMVTLEKASKCASKAVKEFLKELEDSAEEIVAFCTAYKEDLKNRSHKPSFLVPKTPVSRRLRNVNSRKNENAVQQTWVEAATRVSARNTRNALNRNTSEIIDEDLNSQNRKPRRAASKVGNKKIKEKINIFLNDEEQNISNERKRLLEEPEEDEVPLKTRRIGRKRVGNECSEMENKHNPISLVADKLSINDSAHSSLIVAKEPNSTSSPINATKEQKLKTNIELMDKKLIKSDCKNESVSYSAIASQVSSGADDTGSSFVSHKSVNQTLDFIQSSDFLENQQDQTKSSILADELQGITAHSLQEQDISKKDITVEHKICDTTITILPHSEGNTSIVNSSVETVNEKNTNKVPANATFLSEAKEETVAEDTSKLKNKTQTEKCNFSCKALPLLQTMHSLSPVIKLQKLTALEIKVLGDITGKSSSIADIKKAKKKPNGDANKPVFSPYSCSPVKDRVAAFERLKNEREHIAEQAAIAVKAIETTAQPVRMTRTKARAMAAAAAAQAKEQSNEEKIEKSAAVLAARKSLNRAKKISIIKERRELEMSEDSEFGKENSLNSFAMSQLSFKGKSYASASKKYKTTPLLSNISNLSHSASRNPGLLGSSSKKQYNVVNGIISGIESLIVKPAKMNSDDLEKKKEEIRRRMEKEEEVKKKKEELLRAKIEENKRKREEKMQKAQLAREIREKEKLEMQMRLEKEKEEKLKLILQEREEKIKEQLQQKKQQAQQKAVEMEERRKLEEAAKKAKIKEQEEEQQRLQAARKKEQEEHLKHLAEEREAALLKEQQAKAQAKLAKEKEAKEKAAKEKLKAAAAAKPQILDKTFDVTQGNKITPKTISTENANDYGIDEEVGDSSDEEEVPKRPVPLWARRERRKKPLQAQSYVPARLAHIAVCCEETTPDILRMFDHLQAIRRTSSAIWRTPPRLSTLPKL